MLAIYKRVSKDEQAEFGVSLDNQELRGKELARKIGLEYEVYTDAGYKGSIPYNKRPALNRLIDDIYAKKITAIFVFDINRLSRGNIIQIETLKTIFKEHNVALYEVGGLIDLKDTNVEFITDIRSLVNAKFLKDLSANLKSNLESNIQKGKVSGGPMQKYGYTKDKDKMLVINPVEAKVVKLIFKLATEGNGTKVIANILNEKGIPTKRNTSTNSHMIYRGEKKTKFVWIDSSVYKILTSTLYVGKRLYREKIYDVPHLAIIDEATYELAQQQLKNRNQFKNTTNRYEYLLKGLINCPKCGGRFYGKINKAGGNHNYACNSNRMGKSCGTKGISIEYLDNLVISQVLKMDKFIEEVFSKWDGRQKKMAQVLIEGGRKEIEKINKRLENLWKLGEEAEISGTVFKGRLDKLNEELAVQEFKIKRAETDLELVNQKEDIIKVTKDGIAKFKKLKTVTEKANFLRTVILEINLFGNVTEKHNYAMAIYFRIAEMENYLISNTLEIDETKNGQHKVNRKLIKDYIELETTVIDNPENGKFLNSPHLASYKHDW